MKTNLMLISALSIGIPWLAQEGGPPTKQEVIGLVQKADERATIFEQANESAKAFIPDSTYAKGVQAASKAHQGVAAIKKSGPTAYTLVTLIIALDDVSLSAANDAEAISRKAMTIAVAEHPVSLNALAAADSMHAVQASITEISKLVGRATLRLIKAQVPG